MFTLIGNILGRLFRKPVTRLYPVEVKPACAGCRGQLHIRIEDCIFCGACQRRCPANAITVSKQPKSWTLDPYRCIVCGYCVELCPKKCLEMRPEHFKP